MKSKGVYIPAIKLNAWKSIANTKIDLIDYGRIITLSNIEELKESLLRKTDFLMGFLYTNMNQTGKGEKQTLKMILLDIVQTEKTIERHIESFEKNKDIN